MAFASSNSSLLVRRGSGGVTLMGRGSTDVRFVTRVVNRENLNAVAALLQSGTVKVVMTRPTRSATRRTRSPTCWDTP